MVLWPANPRPCGGWRAAGGAWGLELPCARQRTWHAAQGHCWACSDSYGVRTGQRAPDICARTALPTSPRLHCPALPRNRRCRRLLHLGATKPTAAQGRPSADRSHSAAPDPCGDDDDYEYGGSGGNGSRTQLGPGRNGHGAGRAGGGSGGAAAADDRLAYGPGAVILASGEVVVYPASQLLLSESARWRLQEAAGVAAGAAAGPAGAPGDADMSLHSSGMRDAPAAQEGGSSGSGGGGGGHDGRAGTQSAVGGPGAGGRPAAQQGGAALQAGAGHTGAAGVGAGGAAAAGAAAGAAVRPGGETVSVATVRMRRS